MPGHNPKCSVVMPAFRAGRYIREAALSVLEQSLEDLELIVVDDGCPEGCSTLVADLHDPRVTIHRQENRGVIAARNAGLGLARGESILFLDADDRLRPGALHRLGAALESDPKATVAYGRAARTDAGGRVSGLWQRPIATAEPTGDVLRVLLEHNFIRCPGAALIRASCFGRTHGFDPAAFPGSDWELWCRLANLGPIIGVRGEPVIDYRFHSASMTLGIAADPAQTLRSVAVVFDNPDLVGNIPSSQLPGLRRRREASIYAWLGTECMRAADMVKAEQLFKFSLDLWPWTLRVQVLRLLAVARIRPPWFGGENRRRRD